MREKLRILLLLVLIPCILMGCNISPLERGEIGLPGNQLPKYAKEYLNKLGNMEYYGSTEISLQDGQAWEAYDQIVNVYENNKAFSEWRIGGISSLLSMATNSKYIRSTINSPPIDSDYIFLKIKDYYVYKFISNSSGINESDKKECFIYVEKGTETSNNPHMYLWSSYRISGIGRPGLFISSDDKVYTDYIEIGGDN